MSNIETRMLIKKDVADRLLDYAAHLSNYQEMVHFQNKFKAIVEEYDASPYSVLSTGIFFGKLESFKEWLPELIANKNKIIPLLASNMLKGDMFAASIYKEIYASIDKKDLIITYDDLHINKELRVKFDENGAAEPALVKITAERWLTSKEAAEVFVANNQGNQVLCISNELLGIHNDFVNCGES